MVYIGIDLGTTYSCVSVIENGNPVVIYSDDGKFIIPSAVAYCDSEILVGNSALNSNTDLSNILYDSKRLIGWKLLVDLPNPESRNLWTFNVDTRDDFCGYVLSKGKPNERFIKAEEVSAEILKSLKAVAERYLNTKVTGVVVTIPALFNEQQIDATKRAVELAGLELKYLLHEPTAAAIAYNHKAKLEDSKILIFDFGGGTLDISIVEINKGKLRVKAVTGDIHLGGQDIDSKIMKYVNDISIQESKFNIIQQPKLIKRLRTVCREAKEALSFEIESYNIHMDIDDKQEVNVELTKVKFNELCNELFNKSMELVDIGLNTAQISSKQLDHVILVGGSTRIPNIQQRLMDKFGPTNLKFNLNRDEVVAHGAAIIADALEKRIAMPLIENNSDKILFYYLYFNNGTHEGRICLFNSLTCLVEEIAKFHDYYEPYQVATTQNKIFGIDNYGESFEIYDLNTRQISRGPNPLELRYYGSFGYTKDKLYYLCGFSPRRRNISDRVDVLIDGRWQTGPTFPHPIMYAPAITCDEILYVINVCGRICRLSDDEREWIEVGESPKIIGYFGVASLNGKIYITGGIGDDEVFKSCLCFDPSVPNYYDRSSRIADMNYGRMNHSLIVANGKLYAIGGFQKIERIDVSYHGINFCDAIEEYDPQTNKWREVGKININSISLS